MCGIGGFSLSKKSDVNPRALTNALLTALEDRGYMASGFAYQTKDAQGSFKAAVNGSSLSLKSMPKNARTGIVHTRLATHGSIHDNRNNHPVASPNGRISLVHNGVIYNHDDVRRIIPARKQLPPVDTSVIPALIEHGDGVDLLTELDGDAAIAWLDTNDLGRLHVARLEHSPLTVAQLEDGSFVFASTEALLWRVLIQLNLMPEFMQTVQEFTYFTVRKGVIESMTDLPRPIHATSAYDYGYYRHQTAGAKGSGASCNVSYADPWQDDLSWSDDEAWDDYYANEAKATKTGTQYLSADADPSSFIDDNDAWYIAYKAAFHVTPAYMYYHADEYDQFKNDVFMLQKDSVDYTYVDHGAVTINGTLESMSNKANTALTLVPNDVF